MEEYNIDYNTTIKEPKKEKKKTTNSKQTKQKNNDSKKNLEEKKKEEQIKKNNNNKNFWKEIKKKVTKYQEPIGKDEEQLQRTKDLLEIQIREQEKFKNARQKDWIPTKNEKWTHKWLGFGVDYEYKPLHELQQPVLMLIKDDGTIELFENVKQKLYKFKSVDNQGNEKIKAFILTDDKLLKIPYGEDKRDWIRIWIQHENEATPYPINTEHDSNIIWKFIEEILLNYRTLNQGEESGWMAWLSKNLHWIFIGIGIIYLLWTFNIIPHDIIGQGTTTAIQNATATNTNELLNQAGGVTVQ